MFIHGIAGRIVEICLSRERARKPSPCLYRLFRASSTARDFAGQN
jgi:hypothetical protein